MSNQLPSGSRENLLDGEQQAAVQSTDKAIAVLAGPGSGKTRVLSYRARHLLMNDPGSRALLLTFTNKAAAEMKARALGVASVTSDRIHASTFHTFAMHVLRAHGDLIGIDRSFEILDRDEQEELAIQVARASGLSGRLRRWSYLRLRREEIREPDVLAFGNRYQEAKLRANVMDFDDLIVFTADLLEGHSEVAEAYGMRYRHLLIDEFQDTNAAQFAIVKALCRHASTVSVFADDDQAIYRFVGAEAENIRRFIVQLGAREYQLTFNYRCREAIVQHANRLIAADPEASGRQMQAVYPGGEVRHISFPDEEAEAEFIAMEIGGLLAAGTSASDISVLTRGAWRAAAILEALTRAGIPISNWLGESYDPPERRMLALALSVLRSNLNDRQVRALCELMEVEETDERRVDEFLALYEQNPVAKSLQLLRDMAFSGVSVVDLVRQAQLVVAEARPDLGETMSLIVETVASFQQHDPEFTLEHLLSELALGGIGGAPTLGGGVKVASLHRTKGLQWPRVYIIGMEDGTLPDFRAETQPAISEERRACFVGVCRAESHLALTRIRQYRGFVKRASIFLEEMGLDPYGIQIRSPFE